MRTSRPLTPSGEGLAMAKSTQIRFDPPGRERAATAGPAPTALSIQQRLENLAKNQTVTTAASMERRFEEATGTAKSIQQRLEAVQANALTGPRPMTSSTSPLSTSPLKADTNTSPLGGSAAALTRKAGSGGSLTLTQKATTSSSSAAGGGSSASARPPRANSQPAGSPRLATAGDSGKRPGLPSTDVLQRLASLPVGDTAAKPPLTSKEAKSETSSILQKFSIAGPESRGSTPAKLDGKARTDSSLASSRFQTPGTETKSQTYPQAITPSGRLTPFASSPISKVSAPAPAKAEENTLLAPAVAKAMPLLEEYLKKRYDPIMSTVKQLTDRVEKARKLVKRERIRYSWDDKENQANIPALMTQPQVDQGSVHVIICALDYIGTSSPLTCTADGDNMQELCRACGVTDVSILYNRQATSEQVAAKIKRVGSRCKAGDYFVFFYAGHGANVPDEDGDEKDGKDEAFCFVTPDGKLHGGWMTDDQFAYHVTSSVSEDVNILVVSDCCHSGTICDFGSKSNQWGNTQAVSLSGCRDSQTSGDTGTGGIFTHSLLLALESMVADGDGQNISLKRLFERTLDKDDQIFDSAQDITMNSSAAVDLRTFTWPLVPKAGYKAPWKGRST